MGEKTRTATLVLGVSLLLVGYATVDDTARTAEQEPPHAPDTAHVDPFDSHPTDRPVLCTGQAPINEEVVVDRRLVSHVCAWPLDDHTMKTGD